jgi:hypothetical protein
MPYYIIKLIAVSIFGHLKIGAHYEKCSSFSLMSIVTDISQNEHFKESLYFLLKPTYAANTVKKALKTYINYTNS